MDIRPTGIDHIVLRVADVDRSLAFYTQVLGLSGERVEEWRAGDVFFPSVRVDAGFIIDLLPANPDEARGRNVDHFCLVVEPVDLEAVAASGRFDVVSGPSHLFGARGEGIGLYVRDPDGNVVELRHYGRAT
jgi:catechol 2,3-dioxygenase-like lactoylglutathione lyase family enzyme